MSMGLHDLHVTLSPRVSVPSDVFSTVLSDVDRVVAEACDASVSIGEGPGLTVAVEVRTQTDVSVIDAL